MAEKVETSQDSCRGPNAFSQNTYQKSEKALGLRQLSCEKSSDLGCLLSKTSSEEKNEKTSDTKEESSAFLSCFPPIIQKLQTADNILLLGMGGGYDIYGGLFLYDSLKKSGKKVFLANYSFTDGLHRLKSVQTITPYVFKVTHEVESNDPYFPELYLAKFLQVPVYTFRSLPPCHLYEGLKELVRHLGIETVVCIDCGMDAILYGSESSDRNGSPYDDMCTVVAVNHLMQQKLFYCA
jgi:hypothetical protein